MVFHFWHAKKNNSSLQQMIYNQNKSVSSEIHMDLRITKKPKKARQLNHNMHLSWICCGRRCSPTFNSHYFKSEGIFANRQTNLKHEILFKKTLFLLLSGVKHWNRRPDTLWSLHPSCYWAHICMCSWGNSLNLTLLWEGDIGLDNLQRFPPQILCDSVVTIYCTHFYNNSGMKLRKYVLK